FPRAEGKARAPQRNSSSVSTTVKGVYGSHLLPEKCTRFSTNTGTLQPRHRITFVQASRIRNFQDIFEEYGLAVEQWLPMWQALHMSTTPVPTEATLQCLIQTRFGLNATCQISAISALSPKPIRLKLTAPL